MFQTDRSPIPTRGQAIGVALLTFLAVLLVFLPGQLIQLLNLPVGLMVTSLLIFGAAGLLLPPALNASPRALLPLGGTRAAVALGLVVGLANMGFANLLMGALREWLPLHWSQGADAVTRLLAQADHPSRALLVIAAGVTAPLGEELFFRGWLQGVLVQRVRPAWAVVWVAVLFSLTHLDPVGFVPRVELGILFGLIRHRTGSLWPAIAAHAGHNLLSTVVLYAADDPLAELEQPFDWALSGAIGAGSLGLTLLLLRLLTRAGTATQGTGPAPLEPIDPRRPVLLPHPTYLPLALAVGSVALLTATLVLWLVGGALPGAALVPRPEWLPRSPLGGGRL